MNGYTTHETQSLIFGILQLVQAIIICVISGLFARDSRKRKVRQEKIDERASVREAENKLSLRQQTAIISICVANSKAIKGGEINGDIDHALYAINAAQEEYNEFMQEIVSKQLAKR